jgi:predicted MFS family arabinose efflux permease
LPSALILALLGARTADECAGFLTPGAFESFHRDLGLSYSSASLVLVIAAPGAIVGNVFTVLGDHRSRRAIGAGGAFGYAAALLAFGTGQSFAVLAIASFALGMSATALVHGTELALVDVAGKDVTAYFARGMMFGAVGGVLGPTLLILAAATGLGWRAAFLACAPAMAAYGVWLSRLPLPPPSHPEPRRPLHALRPILRDARVWYCGLLALILGPLQYPFTAFLIAYLERVRGAPAALATAVPVTWVAGSVIAATASSRRGTRPHGRAMRVNAFLLLAATLGATTVPSIPVIVVCVFVNGLALTRFMLALKTRVVELHPGRVGSVSAVVTTTEFAGFLLPIVAGTVADTFGLGAGFGFYAVIAAVLVITVAAGDRYFSSSRAI